MKRAFTLALIAAIGILLGGCTDFSDEIQKLQEQIDALKSDQIKTIDEQVTSIKSSLTDLQLTDKEVRQYISQLEIQREKFEDTSKDISDKIDSLRKSGDENLAQYEEYKKLLGEQISSLDDAVGNLKDKDKALVDRIDSLKTYTDTGVKSAKDWVSGTFMTLEQYDSTAAVIAGIQAQIETINTDKVSKEDLDKAIQASESSIKDWVSDLLGGYYTAKQTDALLESLKMELSKSGIGTDVTGLIKDYEDKLAQTKEEITEAYTSAITNAINKHNGVITSRIASEISTVNGKISSLNSDILALEERMDKFEDRLSKLEELVRNLTNSGSNRRITGETTDIDGVIWMNYNVGADESDLLGDTFTYEEAKTACPSGYRLPRIDEVDALDSSYSSGVTAYNMVSGSWFSGKQNYSVTLPAVFIPGVPSEEDGYSGYDDYYYYWSSTDSTLYPALVQGNGPYIWYISNRWGEYLSDEWNDDSSRKCYVRCVKSDIVQREIVGETTVIDGVTWMNYDVANSSGDYWMTYDDALYVCPEGYRVPSKWELMSLMTNSSENVRYRGYVGRWYSGSQQYSDTAPAIFLDSACWSVTSSEDRKNCAYYSESSSEVIEKFNALHVRCLKKTENFREITGETTTINGMTWMNYNLGANDINLAGDLYTYEEAKDACPTGYRLPNTDEVSKLFQYRWHSQLTYNGFSGIWITGSQTYSSSDPALFFPYSYTYWALPDEDAANYSNCYGAYGYCFGAPLDENHSVRCIKDE